MADCDSCGKPILDTAFVCHDEAIRLEGQLGQAAELWAELDITITRQDRMAAPGPHRRGRAPAAPIRPDGQARHYGDQDIGHAAGLPANLAASDAADAIRNTVTTWARHIEAERGEQAPAEPADLMRWVAGKLHWIRYRAEAGEAFDELGNAAALVWRTVDRPAERRWLGPCGEPDGLAGTCRADLHAHPKATTVRCRTCGTQHLVAERRAWLDGLVMERAYTAAEIEGAYPHVKADRIRQWASRGQIVAHGSDRYGRPTYPLAEVLDLAARIDTKRQRRERMAV